MKARDPEVEFYRTFLLLRRLLFMDGLKTTY